MKFLNGNKTTIGAILWLVTAGFVLITGESVEGFTSPESWVGYAEIALPLLATLFSGIGVIHKALKKIGKK